MIFDQIKYHPTYWENGMKLSAGHFQHLENSIEDGMRDARAASLLAHGAFGLLPYSPFQIQSLQGQEANRVKVVLNACRAIMPGGHRVEILPENIAQLKIPQEAPSVEFEPQMGMRYHVYLTVHATDRVPAGIPETRPIRHPYLCHDYQLECLTQTQGSTMQGLGANRIKIAEWQDAKIVEGYIPPCLTITGFPLLEKWYQFFQTQLENVVRLSAHITNEYRRKDPPKTTFTLPLIHFIRASAGHLKWELPQSPPQKLIIYFGNLAGLVKSLIESCDRDFVRNQLKNGQLHQLNAAIAKMLSISSSPMEEMAAHISTIQKFVHALLSVLQTLLNLEKPVVRHGERHIGE